MEMAPEVLVAEMYAPVARDLKAVHVVQPLDGQSTWKRFLSVIPEDVVFYWKNIYNIQYKQQQQQQHKF